MPLSFREAEQLHLIVGQDGILRAGWQPARADLSTAPTCPTTSAGFPAVGKLSSSNHECSQHCPPTIERLFHRNRHTLLAGDASDGRSEEHTSELQSLR